MISAGKNTKKNVAIITNHLLALVFIVNGNSLYLTIPQIAGTVSTVLLTVLVCSTLLLMFLPGVELTYERRRKGYIICLILLVYLIGFAVISKYNTRIYLRNVLTVFVIGTYYFQCNSPGRLTQLLQCYRNLVVVIAAISVACWLLCSVLKVIPPTGTVESWWVPGGTVINNYGWVYFEPQSTSIFGHAIIRNCAFFAEAPMSGFCFAIALLIDLFLNNKTNTISKVILLIAIITTVSTAGIIVAVIAVALKLLIMLQRRFQYSAKRNDRTMLFPVAILTVIAVLICVRLFIAKMKTGSGITRLDDIIACYKAWMDHFFIGNGYENREAIIQYMSEWRQENYGISNSLMHFLSDGGVYIGVLYIAPIVTNYIRTIKNKDYDGVAFMVCFTFAFVITIYTYNYLTIYLLYYFAFNEGILSENTKILRR